MTLPLNNKVTLVIGANGSGKTTLLSACLFFLHGYNTRASCSKNHQAIDIREDIADLLAQPAFAPGFLDFESFISKDAPSKKALLVGQLGTETVPVTLKGNGQLEFLDLPTLPKPPATKVRFALSTPHFTFLNPRAEVGGSEDLLTSGQQNLRNVYWSLGGYIPTKFVGSDELPFWHPKHFVHQAFPTEIDDYRSLWIKPGSIVGWFCNAKDSCNRNFVPKASFSGRTPPNILP